MRRCKIAAKVNLTASRYKPFDFKNGGVCKHPSDLSSADWPVDLKARIVIKSVRRAVSEGHLSVGNASIVDLLCDGNLSVAQAARCLKITPEAVRQQLWRVKRVLPKVLDQVDVKRDEFL